jgi:hypothetical protein
MVLYCTNIYLLSQLTDIYTLLLALLAFFDFELDLLLAKLGSTDTLNPLCVSFDIYEVQIWLGHG